MFPIIKKNATTWTHGDSQIILSCGHFRAVLIDGTWWFELTEPSGMDQFRVLVSDIELIDETNGNATSTYTDGVTLTDALKNLDYPFFKTATGSSVATGEDNVQANWTETDANSDAYIAGADSVTMVTSLPNSSIFLVYDPVLGTYIGITKEDLCADCGNTASVSGITFDSVVESFDSTTITFDSN